MEHDAYGDEAACVIVDERGKLVLDDVYNDFDDDTLRLLDLEVKEVPEMPDSAASIAASRASVRISSPVRTSPARHRGVDS